MFLWQWQSRIDLGGDKLKTSRFRNMAELKPIPLKRSEKWRDWRQQVLPILVFVFLLGGVALFWREVASPSTFLGQVETQQVEISSPDAGLITNLFVEPFQTVKAGDLIAVVTTPAVRKIFSMNDGTVTQIRRRPGEQVGAGDPIVTVTASQSDRIIGFLPASFSTVPTVGMEVEVTTRLVRGTRGVGKVVGLAPNLVQVTNGLSGRNGFYSIGRPISISVPREMTLLPGQDVSLSLRGRPLLPARSARK